MKPIAVLPTRRADKAMNIEKPDSILNYLKGLERSPGIEIENDKERLLALQKQHDNFHKHGFRLSDHGMEEFTGKIL